MPRKLSALGYLAALLCFAFPFLQVSCGGQRIMTVTGAQLVTGTDLVAPDMPGAGSWPYQAHPANQQHVPPSSAVQGACAALVIGLALGMFRDRITGVLSGISGFVAGVLLLLVQQSGQRDLAGVARESMGMVSIDYQPAYYAAVSFALIAGIAVLATSWRRPAAARAAPSQGAPPPSPPAGQSGFCGNCGAPAQSDGKFCGECGKPYDTGQGASGSA
jgi:hypothetical protein